MDKDIIERIRMANDYAFQQHGALTTDPVRAALILTEEVGEVAKAALEVTRPCTGARAAVRLTARRLNLLNELAQVASLVIKMMVNVKMQEELSAKQQ